MKGIIELCLKFIKENSVVKILITFAIVIVVVVAFVLYIFKDTATKIAEDAYDKKQTQTEQQHQDGIERRANVINPLINEKLNSIRLENKLDCVFILEGHNGGTNLRGLPFTKFSMTYESTNYKLEPISDEFTNQQLQHYNLVTNLQTDGFVFMNVDSLVDVDNRTMRIMNRYGYRTIYLRSLYKNEFIGGVFGFFDRRDLTEHELFEMQRTFVRHLNTFSNAINNNYVFEKDK